jgi:capsular exopolysaccharide synthesis family protein
MAQEGKTIISASIARSLMTSQEKGIIIDADLRRPNIHTMMDLDNSTGLSSFLAGESEFNELIKKTPFERLDAITSGPIPKNPSELLNSVRMNELVDALSAAYDYIIFDSAPVLGMSDSLILSAVVDSVIVVVKAYNTPSDALLQTKKALNSVNANTIGFILNGVDLKSKFAGSSDYYCSPYIHDKRTDKKLL